jgi:hypothetical protein
MASLLTKPSINFQRKLTDMLPGLFKTAVVAFIAFV